VDDGRIQFGIVPAGFIIVIPHIALGGNLELNMTIGQIDDMLTSNIIT
jgi:hypothetical protein